MKSIHVVSESLPEAWEEAVLQCWEEGDSFSTQYDKSGDPKSKDVIALIHVKKPFSEPRIHKAFPGGLNDLEKYRSEVLYGVHDYFMNDLSNENRWQYTYSERIFEYKVPCNCNGIVSDDLLYGGDICPKCGNTGEQKINQVDEVVDMLKKAPHTRRAQIVTWQTWKDLGKNCVHGDPACLQRIQVRVQDGKLNMNVSMRSNDGYKAAFMNMYAFTELQKVIADEVGVDVGEYSHYADSFHIYGSYFKEFEGFLKGVKTRKFNDRVFSSVDCLDFFIDGCDELLLESNMPEHKKELIRRRKVYLQNKLLGD